MKNLLLVSIAILFSSSIYCQRSDDNDYWNTWRYKPKEGMVKDFEKAAAKKTAMFNNTPEKAIITYKVVTGPNSGTYERVESNKYAKDYDLDRSAEGDYWNENVGKFIEKSNGQVRWDRMNNASYKYDSTNGKPAKYVQRTTYSVKANGILSFRRFMARLTKVAEKRGWSEGRLLFRIVSGGNRNEFVLVQTFDTYVRPAEPEIETSMEEDYNELFGWGTWTEDLNNFDASLEIYGEFTETMVLVPEMSTGMMK